MSTINKKKNPTVEVDGIVLFFQGTKPDQFGKFSTNFIPKNETELAKLVQMGVTNKEVKAESLKTAITTLGLDLKHVFGATKDPQYGPLPVVDSQSNPVTELVGNGSTVRLRMSVSKYISPKTGELVTKLYMNSAQILKLVPYVRSGTAIPVAKDGEFISTNTGTTDGTTDTDTRSILS